jgi:phosphoribosylaminoimidazole (AIR) synthetase
MFETFNMGVGMIAIVEPGAAGAVLEGLGTRGEPGAWVCGVVESGRGRVRWA